MPGFVVSPNSATATRVLDILRLFSETQPELSVDEIGAAIQAPRSTTYRYVRTLIDEGFLARSASGKLHLGPIFHQFRPLISVEHKLSTVALPIMRDLMRETNETVLLTRRFDRFSICVERVEGPHAIRISFERGHTQPLHAGASSKILLAFSGPALWDRYLSRSLTKFTDRTVTAPARLRAHLREIVEQGYCTSESEVDEGATAVAVPILNGQGGLLAGLSIAGPTFRIDDETTERHLQALRAGAAAIESGLP